MTEPLVSRPHPGAAVVKPVSPWFDVNTLSRTFVFPTSGIALTAIPKNACTVMKAALLAVEGIVIDIDDADSIHRCADDFRVVTAGSLRGLVSVNALRDPMARARSAYIEKLATPFGAMAPFAREVVELVWSGSRGESEIPDAASVTFREFVNYLHFTANPDLDPHFRPQVDFWCLDYDHVIDLEVAGALEATFEELGVPFTPRWYGSARSAPTADAAPGSGCDVSGEEWRRRRMANKEVPPLAALLDDFLATRLAMRFADDYALRRDVLGV